MRCLMILGHHIQPWFHSRRDRAISKRFLSRQKDHGCSWPPFFQLCGEKRAAGERGGGKSGAGKRGLGKRGGAFGAKGVCQAFLFVSCSQTNSARL